MGYSIESNSSNCYPNSTCLINKFNIKDDKILSKIEAEITLAKAAILEFEPLKQPLNFKYYKDIHRYLFEDLYEWAGTLRTVNISKKGTNFCPVIDLEFLCDACFQHLEHTNFFSGLSKSQFIYEIVDFYCDTNFLHPFREGNGRVQRIFISKLIKNNGYKFNFSNIDSDFLMFATIQSSIGVKDYLLQIFNNEIK